MERHEYFECICAAASVGQASGSELAELEEHLPKCTVCQQSYNDFLQFSGVRCASNETIEEVGSNEALSYIGSALFQQKFVKRAEAAGISFSHLPLRSNLSDVSGGKDQKSLWRTSFIVPVAASLLLVAGVLSGYFYGIGRSSSVFHKDSVAASTPQAAAVQTAPAKQLVSDEAVARLGEQNRALALEIESLKTTLAESTSTMNQLQISNAASEKERVALSGTTKEYESLISNLESKLDHAQVDSLNIKSVLEKAHIDSEASQIVDKIKIHDLTEQLAEQSASLDRERQLLAATRDIRDLMAARNLHIADVFDTDPKGKTRPVFGRMFFTEGKSLIFYAYDFNDKRVQEAGYNYRVWGTRQAPGEQPRSLGIFFSDDKTQNRWVFKYDDPKVLSEIDSVFVTLESPKSGTAHPQGAKLLYAYLRNQPNHP